MACTTILVGKKATNDGSTMISRNDDNPAGKFHIKKYVVVQPDQTPAVYRSVISHVEIPQADRKAIRYTAMPEVDVTKAGIWASAGINADNVAMTATETITTNERVLAADPLVVYQPATDEKPEVPGGIGEEDLVSIVLPFVHTAREGVLLLGELLEKFGTYENNGIAFSDADEVWYLESVGGHHWLARRLPDDAYAVLPNEFNLDFFDFDDALGEGRNYLCSKDMKQFIADHHLDLSMDGKFSARVAFGSHTDADHVYNTPRQWYGQRYFNPRTVIWDGPNAQFTPRSDDLPWCRVPEHKITVEDVKYVLSSTYQGTPFDPYSDSDKGHWYRPIGISRTAFVSVAQIRNDVPAAIAAINWIAFASNVYNALVPQYTNVNTVPEYFSDTTETVSTGSFYWTCRLISALADSQHHACEVEIERYQDAVQSQGRTIMAQAEAHFDPECDVPAWCEKVNQQIADMVREKTDALLDKVLFITSNKMINAYSRSDN